MGCDVNRDVEIVKIALFQSTHPGWGATLLLCQCRAWQFDFNPRTPGGVRPHDAAGNLITGTIFQSTHPGWGATCARVFDGDSPVISIHAPRVGCDAHLRAISTKSSLFQSTHPGWGATLTIINYNKLTTISIHAPRVGCDSIYNHSIKISVNFNPRTPGGVRLKVLVFYYVKILHFNPRTPGGVRL